MPLQRGKVLGYDFNRMVVDFTMFNQGKTVRCAISTAGRVRPGVRHRDRRLLAQKRTEANLDAAHARPIVSSAPIRKQGWS